MGPPEPPSKADILGEIQQWMKELFELDAGRVQPEARLIEDLELDSLDAFDLAVKVEETTGLAFDETKIRELRTIDDVIVAIQGIVASKGMPARTSPSAQADPQTDP
jgi:acyl carrier protein